MAKIDAFFNHSGRFKIDYYKQANAMTYVLPR